MSMRMLAVGSVGLGLLVLASGCCKTTTDTGSTKPEGAPAASSAAPAPATPPAADPAKSAAPAAPSAAAPAASAAGPAGAPTKGVYSMASIKTIDDTCSKAHVLMSVLPANLKGGFPWTFLRQAVVVHQEFSNSSGAPPTKAGDVQYEMYDHGTANKALVAHCGDGATCNKLAAMYKALVPTSNPRPICGAVPDIKGTPQSVRIPRSPNQLDLPKRGDTQAQCARLGSCAIYLNPATQGDPSVECQKAPSKFKLDCALKTTCQEVADCAK